jgi:HK97 gp10 family phage protein
MTFVFRVELDHVKKRLRKVADKAKTSSVYVGAQAAAEVIYVEAKLRAPTSKYAHWFYGTHSKYFFNAGNLRDSIYQVMSKDNSGNGKATYHIAWNHDKAPYGFMVEFGTSNAPAHPFLRPAYEATKQEAVAAGIAAFKKDLALT